MVSYIQPNLIECKKGDRGIEEIGGIKDFLNDYL
jgi:hypothetical protein